MSNVNKRDIGFDFVRSVSALWIVCVWHLLAYASPEIDYVTVPISFCSELALSCFMFISGFFLGQKDISNFRDVLEFYKKRFWRFYILFFISAIILLIGGLFADKMWFQTPQSFISTVLGLSSFVDPSVGTIWFMSMLMMFYIVTPFILFGEKNIVRRISVVVILYSLFFVLYYLLPSVDARLFRFFPIYALGLLTPQSFICRVKKSNLIAIISFITCFLLTVFSVKIENQYLAIVVSNLLYVVRFYSAILILIWLIDKINLSGCGGRIELVIGFVSYISLSLYLFHRPIYQVLTIIFSILNNNGVINCGITWCILYFVYVPIVLFLSYIIQKLYDNILLKVR